MKSNLLSALSSGPVTVYFKKKDGTERRMFCTIKETLIPEDKKPIGSLEKKNENVARVFDLELNEWRSFRFDSIQGVVVDGGSSVELLENTYFR